MIGIGTIANTGAVIAGGLVGMLFKRGLSQRFQDTIMQAIGLAVMFIGISGALEKMFTVQGSGLSADGTMMCAVSLAAGAVIGEWLNIERRRPGKRLQIHRRIRHDHPHHLRGSYGRHRPPAGRAGGGPVHAVHQGDPGWNHRAIFSAAFGVGAVFSAIPLLLFQGSITLLARGIQVFLTTPMIDSMSMLGSMLIFCVGVNMIFPVKIKVANLLPSLVIVILYTAWLG